MVQQPGFPRLGKKIPYRNSDCKSPPERVSPVMLLERVGMQQPQRQICSYSGFTKETPYPLLWASTFRASFLRTHLPAAGGCAVTPVTNAGMADEPKGQSRFFQLCMQNHIGIWMPKFCAKLLRLCVQLQPLYTHMKCTAV